jgi:adenylylsulfate kinase
MIARPTDAQRHCGRPREAHWQSVPLTGLSGAGKTTIARAVARVMLEAHQDVEYLDGDELRALFPVGYDGASRDAHVLRAGFLASRLERHGVTTICAFMSPRREPRDLVRTWCGRFLEVHVATPLQECERRDPKGLYARARRGEIRDFTGLDAPYEMPLAPELTLDTTHLSLSACVTSVVELMLAHRSLCCAKVSEAWTECRTERPRGQPANGTASCVLRG